MPRRTISAKTPPIRCAVCQAVIHWGKATEGSTGPVPARWYHNEPIVGPLHVASPVPVPKP